MLSLWKGVVFTSDHHMPTMREIAETVCAEYGLKFADLFSFSRRRLISWPRQDFMWRCRQVLNLDGSHRFSLPQIGMYLGGMDHATIIHGVRRHDVRRLDVDSQICHSVAILAAE